MTVIASSAQTVAEGQTSTAWSPSGTLMHFDLDNDAQGYLTVTRATGDAAQKPLTVAASGRDSQQVINGPCVVLVPVVAGRLYRFVCTKAATGGAAASIAAEQ